MSATSTAPLLSKSARQSLKHRLYVQCAYLQSDESTLQRDYGALEGLRDRYPKLLVTLDDIALPQGNGILQVQAWDFEERVAQTLAL